MEEECLFRRLEKVGRPMLHNGWIASDSAMLPGNDQKPTDDEIERQLHKILAADRFLRSQRNSQMLRLIVSSHLRPDPKQVGELTETLIRQKLFPNRRPNDEEDAIVRTTASDLRKKLAEYYETEGYEDPVIIEIPKGRYIPRFERNALSGPAQHYQYALTLASIHFPDNVPEAVGLLEFIERTYPQYAARANASLAELCIYWSCCNVSYYAIFKSHWPSDVCEYADELATRAITSEPSLALPYIIKGAVHCCHFRWTEAKEAFETALACSQSETLDHWLYSAFLIATGQKDRALKLIELRTKKRPNDANALLIYALFLYLDRQFKRALDVLENLPRVGSWLGGVLECAIYIFVNRLKTYYPAMAYYPIGRIPQPHKLETGLLKEPYYYENRYIGLELFGLMSDIWLDPREWQCKRFLELLDWFDNHKKAGVTIFDDLCHDPVQAALGNLAKAYNPVVRPCPKLHYKSLHRAIRCLRRACARHHPLMVWLHLWPIFDPWRNVPEFKALIDRMHLPKSV
jgi:hypothetical protein